MLSADLRSSDLHDTFVSAHSDYLNVGDIPLDLGTAGLFLTLAARDLGLPAPVEPIGGGSFGAAWTTTHERQVLKVTSDPHELGTWAAIKCGVLPTKLRRIFAGCVHVEILKRPPCWVTPDWHTRHDTYFTSDNCECKCLALIWKERCRTPAGAARYLPEALEKELRLMGANDLKHVNNGYRGKRTQQLVSFDGRVHGTKLTDYFRDAANPLLRKDTSADAF